MDETIDLHKVNSKAPFGGDIGPADSSLHDLLKFSKIIRMHAIFHDAHGYMRTENGIGPGYVYTLTDKKLFRNNMLLGHFSAILSLHKTQDQPDIANFSQLNIDRIVFDENNQETPPFNFGLCCGSNCKFDRSLLVILIHHLIIFMLVVFCITYLTVCETENRFASGILALLSACLGHILTAPKQ